MFETGPIVVYVLLGAVILYQFYSLKLKKTNSLTLEQRATELSNQIKDKEDRSKKLGADLESLKLEFQHLTDLEANSGRLKQELDKIEKEHKSLAEELQEMYDLKTQLETELVAIKSDLSIYMHSIGLVNLGFFPEPEYIFNNSSRYKEEIKIIRQKQTKLIKENLAVDIPGYVNLIVDDSYSKKVLAGQVNLMLKAFNIECDNLISTVKTTNYPNVLERIVRAASDIEKQSISLKCGFTQEYIELKLLECEMQYQYKKLDYQEKIEQAAIKEQMREEEKARREAEKILKEAEREEEALKKALDKVRQEFDLASEEQKQKYEEMLKDLEEKLKEAEEKNKRALSMAQLTKSGHVYIISNIGSFGENVFKIGMTRRLEPMDRVKELGDASVPFEFDVHGMIYSENAPELETKLHNEFSEKRMNLVNPRKEFFYVTLDEIEEWSNRENYNLRLTKFAEATAYRESEAIRARGDARTTGQEMETLENKIELSLGSENEN